MICFFDTLAYTMLSFIHKYDAQEYACVVLKSSMRSSPEHNKYLFMKICHLDGMNYTRIFVLADEPGNREADGVLLPVNSFSFPKALSKQECIYKFFKIKCKGKTAMYSGERS